MPRLELNLASLKNLDLGKVEAAFSRELRAAVADCQDRPTEKAARKVSLVVAIEPEDVSSGKIAELESVAVSFDLKTALPAKKTKAYSMRVDNDARLIWNEADTDNAHQMTLDELGDKH